MLYREGGEETVPTFDGVSHIALTVADVDRSVRWYQQVFALDRLEDVTNVFEPGHDIVILLHPETDIAINIHRHPTNSGERFEERRTGLDHVSFRVRDAAALSDWAAHLDSLHVAHSPIAHTDYGSVLVFRDPDNIQLELFVNPSR